MAAANSSLKSAPRGIGLGSVLGHPSKLPCSPTCPPFFFIHPPIISALPTALHPSKGRVLFAELWFLIPYFHLLKCSSPLRTWIELVHHVPMSMHYPCCLARTPYTWDDCHCSSRWNYVRWKKLWRATVRISINQVERVPFSKDYDPLHVLLILWRWFRKETCFRIAISLVLPHFMKPEDYKISSKQYSSSS